MFLVFVSWIRDLHKILLWVVKHEHFDEIRLVFQRILIARCYTYLVFILKTLRGRHTRTRCFCRIQTHNTEMIHSLLSNSKIRTLSVSSRRVFKNISIFERYWNFKKLFTGLHACGFGVHLNRNDSKYLLSTYITAFKRIFIIFESFFFFIVESPLTLKIIFFFGNNGTLVLSYKDPSTLYLAEFR